MNKDLTCTICPYPFTLRRNLLVHLKNKHGIVPERKRSVRSAKEFTSKSKSKDTKLVSGKITCPECFKKCQNYKRLREHLYEDHNIEIPIEKFTFVSEEEFVKWKKIYENTNHVFYTRLSKHITYKGQKRSYFYCHRSDSYIPRGKGKHTLKKIGSNKIGVTCPSTMNVQFHDGKVEVELWGKHIGHGGDLARLPLNQEERSMFAERLAAGVPINSIIAEVQKSIPKDMSLTSRIHLIKKKDLYNIKKKIKVSETDTFQSQTENLLVESLENDENFVVFFKNQGCLSDQYTFQEKDFCLVVMTQFQAVHLLKHGNNQVCISRTQVDNFDFVLYTLLVIDEWGDGMPAAFCLSNRFDVYLVTFFFGLIKDKVGILKPRVFMYGCDLVFLEAWTTVMGEVNQALLCSWQVWKVWRNNLLKIQNKEKRGQVLRALKKVYGCPDVKKFETSFMSFLQNLKNDEDLLPFYLYFRPEYGDIYQQWAFCYRKRLGFNTNMCFESLHCNIRQAYLEWKKNKKLNKTISALLNLLRDKLFERLKKSTDNEVAAMQYKIKMSHKESVDILNDNVQIVALEGYYIVKSTSSNLSYTVKPLNKECAGCEFRCVQCTPSICVHMFECCCIANTVGLNICSHIHACCRVRHAQTNDTGGEILNLGSEANFVNSPVVEDAKELTDLSKSLIMKIENKTLSPVVKQQIGQHLKACLKLVVPDENADEPSSDLREGSQPVNRLIFENFQNNLIQVEQR